MNKKRIKTKWKRRIHSIQYSHWIVNEKPKGMLCVCLCWTNWIKMSPVFMCVCVFFSSHLLCMLFILRMKGTAEKILPNVILFSRAYIIHCKLNMMRIFFLWSVEKRVYNTVNAVHMDRFKEEERKKKKCWKKKKHLALVDITDNHCRQFNERQKSKSYTHKMFHVIALCFVA